MLEFANYLKENFREDVSSAEKIIQSKWNNVINIIREAFDDQYSDKKTALYRIQNEFIDPKLAPKSIDVDFLKNNMNYVLDKINSLDEGEIRIIINNEVQKGSTGTSVTGMETECKKGKKKYVVKEEIDEVKEPDDELDAEDNDEKVVKVSVNGNKVTVEPSENTGLEKSEYEFEDKEAVKIFVDSLENLFKGFKIEKEESDEEEPEESSDSSNKEIYGTEEESVLSSNKKLVSEANKFVNELGEEPEDAGEEPEDAGEEPEDAGEEPEDAGEEPEDAGEINWEDVVDYNDEEESDAEECIVAPVRPISSNKLESLDLNKLVNTLIRVENKWYKVSSITENKEVVCIDKEGTKNYFNLEQIDEMEKNISELSKKIKKPEEFELAEEETEEPEDSEEESELADVEETESEEETEEPEDSEEESEPVGIEESKSPEESEEEFELDSDEECVLCKKGSDSKKEFDSVASILTPEQIATVKSWLNNKIDKIPEDIYTVLMDYYSDEMPYGIQKARDGDPYEWLLHRLQQDRAFTDGSFNELERSSEHDFAEEEAETQEESISFVKIAANKYFDLNEDILTPPKMVTTHDDGLTSKPGVINQIITPVKPAPKTPVIKGPTAALTAKPSKPNEKIEKVPDAPIIKKKAPEAALTAKPKAPPKNIEIVKNPPKTLLKAAPKGKYTAKPGKTGQKIDRVKAPQIDKDYSKGGFKG